jgi:hypothetical protein
VATVYIDYEARAASLKAVTDTIINANKQIGDSAEVAAKEGADAYKSMGKAMGAAFSSQEVSKALNSNIASINKNRDALTKLTGESIKFGKAAITLGGQVKQNASEVLKAKEALAKYQQTLNDTGKGTDNTEKKTQSLKGRLRELKEQLSALETAGQEGSMAFEKLAVEAGKLQDQIGDTTERVKVLSSDTFKFDAALGAVKGIAAGFSIAQGAAALFGEENEDLNKTIAKTQGALALLSGLQEIATLVTGQGATKIALQNLFMKDKIVTTTAAAGAVTTLAVAEEGAAVATLATKKSLDLLKIAIAGTGIGLLVIGLGALYAIYQRNSEASKKFQEALDGTNVAIGNAKILLKEYSNDQINLNNQIEVAAGRMKQSDADKDKVKRDSNAKFKTESKALYASQVQLDNQVIELNNKIMFQEVERQKNGALGAKGSDAAIIATRKEIAVIQEKYKEAQKGINDLREANKKSEGAQIKLIDDAEIKRLKDEASAAYDKAKQISDKLIQDRLNAELNGLKLIQVINGDSFKNKEDILKKEAEIERASATASITNKQLRASTLLLIDAKLAQDTEQLKLDEQNKVIANEVKLIEAKKVLNTATLGDEIKQAELSFNIEKSNLEAKIKLNQASSADLELLSANNEKKIQDIKNRGIQQEYTLRVQSFELRKMLGATTLAEELSLIRARAEAELKANELSNKTLPQKEADRKAIIAKTDNDITQAKAVEANKRIDIENAEAEAALILGTATYDQKVKLIEDEGLKQKNSLDKKLLGEEAYNAAVLKINADTTAKLKLEQDARVQSVFALLNAASGVFQELNALGQQQTDERIAGVTAASEVELKAINNSTALETEKARQRTALEKRTQRIIREDKRRQAESDKALALFQAIVGSASAVASAKTLPLKILIAAAGAIQIAAILSRPIPKFEKGGEIGGKRHSEGGTIVEAEQGEYIVNRKQTSAHRKELMAMNQSSESFKKLINDRYVRPAIMNYMLNSKNKEMGVNVNATLNSKTMETELKGLRKDIRNSSQVFSNNKNDSRYLWHKN